ncbi:MAG: ParB/RepB/Spo0J family partition protein [Chloroflexi bacterium]|nr:ParB/RepB/Spo0J family partition protein [Chloroflexota bacterium]
MSESDQKSKKGFAVLYQKSSLKQTIAGNQAIPTGQFARMGSTRSLVGALVVPITDLIQNSQQVRQVFNEETLQELADDIRERGILEPLIVREKEPGIYEIIAGERRYRAAQIAGLTELPVIVREMSDKEARFAMLVENIQREELSEVDEQRFFRQLQDEYNLSITEIAKLISKSQRYVARRLDGELVSLQRPDSEGNHNIGVLPILKDFSQSRPKEKPKNRVRFTPAAFKRVTQTLDNTLLIIRDNPDATTVAQVKQSLADMKQKMSELEQELGNLEITSVEEKDIDG